MTTPLDLITLALRDSGIIGEGQTASAQTVNDAFTRLNFMLGQWQRKRWLIWHLVDTALVSTGAVSYTIGPGGAFNMVRPDRLEAAFVRNLIYSPGGAVDYPLSLLESREDYNNIVVKTLGSFPMYVFYDSAFPLGNLYPWPVPQSGIYELHITTKEILAQFTSLATPINLPPEYFDALYYNLAVRLRVAYPSNDPVMFQMLQELKALARDALNVLRGANTQIPRLKMPIGVPRGGARYNIYTDMP